MKDIRTMDITRIKGEKITEEEDMVIVEYPFTIFINDEELITLLCSPSSLKYLAVGFIFSEGLINSYADITGIKLDEEEGIAHIYIDDINKLSEEFRGKRTITSGCGKGTIFYNVVDSFKSKRIRNPMAVEIERIKGLIREFSRRSDLFLNTGGAHSCALCHDDEIIIFKEDIGRHNALDKVFGEALVDGLDTRDKIVLSSGRISSEMLIKVAKRQVPMVVSRAAPTSLAIEIAEELGITLIGFARGERMNIYTNFTIHE
ncbi:MAG: formate dehydrogenase accessory sulfurtransferase FdhD [Tissierellia bacterium]|nr:formate dehydrogenase accessory sulfurtransferase FdhD [Tissierellia bacterium]